MGVTLPVGFGIFTWPMRLIGDVEEMVTTFGFTDPSEATPPNDVANSISNVLLGLPTFAASTISNQWSMGPGRVVVNRSLGTFEGVGNTSRTGTATITCLPQNCSAIIEKHTALGGRRGRGRSYLPLFFVAEGNVTPTGVILESVRASTSVDFESFRTQLDALNLDLVLLHGDSPNSPTPGPTPILNLNCDPVIGTQRTRLRR